MSKMHQITLFSYTTKLKIWGERTAPSIVPGPFSRWGWKTLFNSPLPKAPPLHPNPGYATGLSVTYAILARKQKGLENQNSCVRSP